MRSRLAQLVALALSCCLAAGCGDAGGDDGDAAAREAATREAAASLCSSLQVWIDDLEQISKELSDRTTTDDDGRRRPHFQTWIAEVTARTERLRGDVEQLDLPTGATAGIDEGLRLLEDTRAEIDEMPDDDRETLGYRVARAFLSLEKVFAKVRTSVERLGSAASDDVLATALSEEPACVDYDDPLT